MDLSASRLTNKLPNFVSWTPDPMVMATDAFTKLDRVQSICQSSLESNRESPGTDTQPTSRACVSGISMEITDMVPYTTGDTSTHTTPDLSEERPDTSHTPGEPIRGNTHTSCVDYIWQKYKDCQISEGATKLLLASWRLPDIVSQARLSVGRETLVSFL